mmetsp:Transcript_5852/g.11740  ORF Transcript_5852/g.11740 Transcript_5852/m.11740 type:complete len:347 (+) Transcript_5852:58-1098(+)
MSSARVERSVVEIASQLKLLLTKAADSTEVDNLLDTFAKEYADTMTIGLIGTSGVGKVLTKIGKSKAMPDSTKEKAKKIIVQLKKAADVERAAIAEEKRLSSGPGTSPELPRSSKEYHRRLVDQNKELYKDPAIMPTFVPVKISRVTADAPTRDEETGNFIFEDYPEFMPNRSPEQVLRGGSFGGTYFRNIISAVTNVKYKGSEVVADSCKPEWVQGLDKKMLTSSSYNVKLNKWGAKCGGSLGMWESSGWISDVDPYGWFQWYCRFFQGRRTDDDDRQVKRWAALAGPKGRFRNGLIKKILNSGLKEAQAIGSSTISPVVRQTLWHWGMEIDKEKIETYKDLKGL